MITESVEAQIATLLDGVCSNVMLTEDPTCSACVAKFDQTGLTYTCTENEEFKYDTACTADSGFDRSLCGSTDVCVKGYPKDDANKIRSA